MQQSNDFEENSDALGLQRQTPFNALQSASNGIKCAQFPVSSSELVCQGCSASNSQGGLPSSPTEISACSWRERHHQAVLMIQRDVKASLLLAGMALVLSTLLNCIYQMIT